MHLFNVTKDKVFSVNTNIAFDSTKNGTYFGTVGSDKSWAWYNKTTFSSIKDFFVYSIDYISSSDIEIIFEIIIVNDNKIEGKSITCREWSPNKRKWIEPEEFWADLWPPFRLRRPLFRTAQKFCSASWLSRNLIYLISILNWWRGWRGIDKIFIIPLAGVGISKTFFVHWPFRHNKY